MRKLQRPSAPEGLASFSYPQHDWDSQEFKAYRHRIWPALEEMQRPTPSSEVLCAYCERPIYANKDGREQRHIEHFWRKNKKVGWPERMFAWDNLYGSCCAEDNRTCGHYKDRVAWPYEPAELIDPCVDNPSDFLVFALDGKVYPKLKLDQARKKRAEETIRVFHLDEPGLLNARRQVLQDLKKAYQDAVDANFTEEETTVWLREECQKMESMAFTAARNRWSFSASVTPPPTP